MLEPGSQSLGFLPEEVLATSQQGARLAGANPLPMGLTGTRGRAYLVRGLVSTVFQPQNLPAVEHPISRFPHTASRIS